MNDDSLETYTLPVRAKGSNSQTHGMKNTAEYRAWSGAKTRCFNSNYYLFHRYGGRGILMCTGWRHDFTAFYKDMGAKPSPKHSLDRIDNDWHYSCGHCEQCVYNDWPLNCRWATAKEQIHNRKPLENKTGCTGVRKTPYDKYQATVCYGKKQVHLGCFETPETAKEAIIAAKKKRDNNG